MVGSYKKKHPSLILSTIFRKWTYFFIFKSILYYFIYKDNYNSIKNLFIKVTNQKIYIIQLGIDGIEYPKIHSNIFK